MLTNKGCKRKCLSNLPEDGLSEYLVQYTHAGHNWLWPLVPFCWLIDVPPPLDVLSPFRDSPPIVDVEDGPVIVLLVTELLLDARLSRLPLLLSLFKGDVSPLWDGKLSFSLWTDCGDNRVDDRLRSRGSGSGLRRGNDTPERGCFVRRASRPKSGLRMLTTLKRNGAPVSCWRSGWRSWCGTTWLSGDNTRWRWWWWLASPSRRPYVESMVASATLILICIKILLSDKIKRKVYNDTILLWPFFEKNTRFHCSLLSVSRSVASNKNLPLSRTGCKSLN